jgi:hypothetical protein
MKKEKLKTLPVDPGIHQRMKTIASKLGMKLREMHERILKEWMEGKK